jgi:hypothetical protein
MFKRLVSCSTTTVYVFVVLLIASTATGTLCSPTAAAEFRPSPSPSPSPTATPSPSATAIAVIDSIVVNDAKQDSAPSSDIELVRAGSSAPEASVNVGTELFNGDKISTKDNDQLVLRVLPREDQSDYVLYLDPNSEVSIGSVCLGRGRFLSWVLNTLRVCTDWGTLATGGTEFEVNIDTGLDVLVYEGQVTFEPRITREPEKKPGESLAAATSAAVASSQTASKDKSLKIMSNGQVVTPDVSLETRREGINYWSGQIIKALQNPAGVTKGFLNYPDNNKRAEAFKTARLEALTKEDSAKGYLDMAQVFNDWDKGAEAEKSLSKVKDTQLKELPEFKVNDAEAERLQGKLTETKIKSIADDFPDYAPAHYVKAKFFEDKASSEPANKSQNLEDAKKNFRKALQNDQGKSQINRQSVEVDLEKALAGLATEDQRTLPWLAATPSWFGRDAATEVISYSGKLTFPLGGQKTQGDAVLTIIGDRFKLTAGEQTFTGRIVGSGISFAMHFDDVGATGGADENPVISLRATKLRKGIKFEPAPEESRSFVFTSKAAGRVGAAARDIP